jgi:hypothetical protein
LRLHQVGAAAGSVLLGVGSANQGVRLRVLHEQQRGHEGPLTGRFVLLDAGEGKHSQALRALLHRLTDADEVLAAIRRDQPGCVNVVNATGLAVEASATAR